LSFSAPAVQSHGACHTLEFLRFGSGARLQLSDRVSDL
jgi:hypothetical protein